MSWVDDGQAQCRHVRSSLKELFTLTDEDQCG
jgi:hypothetical protein